jgi:hypothetical protein
MRQSRSVAASEPVPPAPPPPPRRRGWGAGRILLLIVGIVAALIGLALLAGGGAVLWVDQTQRDDDGYLTTPSERFQTATFALASRGLDVANTKGPDFATNPDRFGHIKIEATDRTSKPLFVGIGPESAVDAYLRGVTHDEVTDLDFHPFQPTYVRSGGGAPRARPGSQRFWAAQAAGSRLETLRWDVGSGNWSVVVMNADASRGVDVDVAVGAKLGFLIWVAIGLLIAGGVVAVGSAFLIYLAVRAPRAPPATAA